MNHVAGKQGKGESTASAGRGAAPAVGKQTLVGQLPVQYAEAEGNTGAPGSGDAHAAAGMAGGDSPSPYGIQQLFGAGRQGSALPAPLRGNLESSLGADLSGVRVHTDDQAAEAAEGLNARAFTVGQSIGFGAGEFDPESKDGQELIAHEVAHTVQQSGASGDGDGEAQLASLDVSTPGDQHEVEAQRFARDFVGGGATPGKVTTPVSTGTVSRAMVQREARPAHKPPPGPIDNALSALSPLHSPDKVVGEYGASVDLKTFGIGPYIKAKLKFDYGVEFEFSRKEGNEKAKAPTVAQATTGVKNHLKRILDAAKADAKWEKQAKIGSDGKTISFTPSVVYTTSVGPFSFELAPFEISLLSYEPGKGLKGFEGPKITGSVEGGLPMHPFTLMGFETQIAATGAFGYELAPDYVGIGKWALQQLATLITSDVALLGGVIGGVAATAIIGAMEIASSGEVTERTERAARAAGSYVTGFLDGTGAPHKGGSKKDKDAYGNGQNAGKAWLAEMTAKYPPGMVQELVGKKAVEIRSTAWNQVWPGLERRAWDEYWEEHGVFDRTFRGYGEGGPNYNNFRRVLAAIKSKGS
jgi:hypothetical protein